MKGWTPGRCCEREVEIGLEETSGELLLRLAPIGAAALLEALAGVAGGTLHATPQDNAEASHARMLAKVDGDIDFAYAPDVVAARIRGVDPWPGARAVLRGDVVKLFRARMTDGTAGRAPGTVIAIDAAGLHVACRGGVVAIREVQAPGRRRDDGGAVRGGPRRRAGGQAEQTRIAVIARAVAAIASRATVAGECSLRLPHDEHAVQRGECT